MPLKFIDTVSVDGRAEKELKFSPRFERFVRNKFSIAEMKKMNPFEIVKKYNLKGITFGNYVTQEERYFYLFKVANQLRVLAALKGNNDIGKGLLTISFGAHGIGGKINAHYSPSIQVINLARGRKGDFADFMKGENSFVHEYGHFLDFYQGHIVDKQLNFNFASENESVKNPNKKTLQFSTPIMQIVRDESYMYQISGSEYLSRKIEIFARLFEASITHYVKMNMKNEVKFFDRSYSERIYYPKAKIIKQKYHVDMVKILKSI